jgi:hypothetical protein
MTSIRADGVIPPILAAKTSGRIFDESAWIETNGPKANENGQFRTANFPFSTRTLPPFFATQTP